MFPVRNSIKYIEDVGLEILPKTGQDERKKPPKLRRSLKNLEYLAESELKFLLPEEETPFSKSEIYNDSSDWSYLEQCFSVVDKVGTGSFGHVLKVFSREFNKFYALKMTKEPFQSDFERGIILMEVYNHILVSCHPNIVSLYTAWEEDRMLHMLLELCQKSLANHKMPEEQCWEVLADMTSALDTIHSYGLGHFDVKLENILVGYDGLYKLGDFGLSFHLQKPVLKTPLEGDAKYLAPELLSSVSNFSGKADIFSLGISILELAGNLRLPSNGKVWSALRQNMFPRTQTKHLSDELFVLLTKMMAPNPAERPTAKELMSVPRIKALVKSRHGLAIQHLAYPTDPVQLFMLVPMMFCKLFLEAAKQLSKHDFSYEFSDLSIAENTTNDRVPLETQKNNIFASTPQVFANPTERQQSSTTNDESTVVKTPDKSVPSTSQNFRYGITPSIMACNISPIKLSREIKRAIKLNKSRKRKAVSVSRKLVFDEEVEEQMDTLDDLICVSNTVNPDREENVINCHKRIKSSSGIEPLGSGDSDVDH